jgi:hypothetical protein
MTCLAESFLIKDYIRHLTNQQYIDFLHLKTVAEQFNYLQTLSSMPLKFSKLSVLPDWIAVKEYARDVIRDGILLIWTDSLHRTGHAMPVTDGEIKWLASDKNTYLADYLENITVANIKKA